MFVSPVVKLSFILLSVCDRCNIDQCQVMKVCVFKAGYKRFCCIQTGKNIDTCLDGISADHETIFLMFHTLRRCINNNDRSYVRGSGP